MKVKEQERKVNELGALKFFKEPKQGNIVKIYDYHTEEIEKTILKTRDDGTEYLDKVIRKVRIEDVRYGVVVSLTNGYTTSDEERMAPNHFREMVVVDEIFEEPEFSKINFFLNKKIVTFN
jgi:hypothetical protein